MIADKRIAAARRQVRETGKRVRLSDAEVRGLVLVVGPQSESFTLAYRPRGLRPDGKRHARKEVKLGEYLPGFGVKEARVAAGRMKAQLLDGLDPAEERRTKAKAEAQAIPLREALRIYKRVRLDPLRTGDEIDRQLRHGLAEFLELPINAIERAKLAACLEDMAVDTPSKAEHLDRYAKTAFAWMVKRGLLDASPMAGLDRPARPVIRDRLLSEDELRAIWLAAREEPYPFGPFCMMLLVTAQRLREVAGMRWSEIDLERATWTLPAERTKSGRDHIVHLAQPALAILEGAKIAGPEGSPFVFSTNGRTPISGSGKAKERMDRVSGVSDYVQHDFRRAAVSVMADLGISETVADRILNHSASGTRSAVARIYQRSDQLPARRHALDAWASYLENLEREPSEKIVPLKA